MNKLTFSINGMGCGACVRKVSNALAAVPGVNVERVEIGSATVACDPSVTTAEAVVRALGDAGYSARKEAEHDER
jgi:copper chaperone